MMHRVLIRIESVTDVVRGVVPSWSPDALLVIPSDVVPEGVTDGDYLLGEVNIGAATAEELRFGTMEKA